jgi:hypothetical protein
MTRGFLAAAILIACAADARAQAPARPDTPKADTEASDDAARRSRAVAGALGAAGWPKASELYVPPPVSRSLLRDPARVAREARSCTTVAIGGEAWPQCTVSWKATPAKGGTLGDDWLDLEITQTPDAAHAHEYLLRALGDNMLPIEALEARYRTARRLDTVGTVALVMESPQAHETAIAVVRANLVFRIRARGTMTSEALPLASRVDEAVLGQQPLTPEELKARRAR